MKSEFSKKWKASKQPRKQRKYLARIPLHLKKKLLSVHLSKNLRKKYSLRNVVVVKGDKVKVLRGKFKGKSAKVDKVLIGLTKVYLENITIKKNDGSNVQIPFRPSNLEIVELNLNDKKRIQKLDKFKKETSKKEKNKVERVENNSGEKK